MFFSVIVPVYNRPDQIQSLLACFHKQTYTEFEVLVVESGSTITSAATVESFREKINVAYLPYENRGQGFSRNYGMQHARGDYFVILDSDVVLDADYLEQLQKNLSNNFVDVYGGPDRLHPAANPTQKAVDYLMTSLLTTGGTRGSKQSVGTYYPRSFNMGFSRRVYEATGGFALPYMGEDIEFSRRAMSLGFSTGLIYECHVYHERKNTLKGFYKQISWFGRARINTMRRFPDTLKPVHFLPPAFMAGLLFEIPVSMALWPVGGLLLLPYVLYLTAVFADCLRIHRHPGIALKTVAGVFYLMWGYSEGMVREWLHPSSVNRT